MTSEPNARLTAKLREALEFFNDHPNFSLRFDRARTSYKIASEIDKLLKEVAGDEPAPAPDLPTDKALQVRFSDTQSFTPLQMEAALCCWEWMLEERAKNPEIDPFQVAWECVGSGGMRQCACAAGIIALQVHDAMTCMGYEHIGAYDWEFIPAVMERLDWEKLVDWVQYNKTPYKPDADNLFGVLYAADRATRPPGQRLFHERDAA